MSQTQPHGQPWLQDPEAFAVDDDSPLAIASTALADAVGRFHPRSLYEYVRVILYVELTPVRVAALVGLRSRGDGAGIDALVLPPDVAPRIADVAALLPGARAMRVAWGLRVGGYVTTRAFHADALPPTRNARALEATLVERYGGPPRTAPAGSFGADIHWQLGFGMADGEDQLHVAAGGTRNVLVVADAMRWRSTGWLLARLAVRRLAREDDGDLASFRAVGAADPWPALAGEVAPAEVEHADAMCFDLVRDRLDQGARPRDFAAAFLELHEVLAQLEHVPPFVAPTSYLSCTAVQCAGTRLSGAHLGRCHALLVRARSGAVERLTTPHTLRELTRLHYPEQLEETERSGLADMLTTGVSGQPLTKLPQRTEHFSCDLEPGDVVVLCTHLPDVTDGSFARALHAGDSPAVQATRLAAWFAHGPGGPRPGQYAFATATRLR